MKQLYISIVSVVLLVIVLVSAVYLLNTVLYAFVFTGDQAQKAEVYPPAPPVLDRENPLNERVCEDDCALTEEQKQEVQTWLGSYESWKTQPVYRYDREGLVAALSFFIVAIPLFIVHFRWLRKEYDAESAPGQKKNIFTLYYYVVSLGTLVASVIFGALFINTVLRTWVVPITETEPPISIVEKNPDVLAVEGCATVCDFTDEEQQLIQRYHDDYDAAQRTSFRTTWQKRMAAHIAGLLLLVPVFWYHWRIVRRNHFSSSHES